MPIEIDRSSGSVRGTRAEVEAVRLALRQGDPAAGGALPTEDEIFGAVSHGLRTPMLTLEVTNSGPGGLHQHVIDAGINAVAVRWSVAGEARSELAGFPFPVLPGTLTRLVGFRPGRPPAADATAVAVTLDLLTALGSEDSEERLGAWPLVRDRLAPHVEPAEADASWQLVRAHTAWTATDGTAAEDLAVLLRAGDVYFVLVQDEDALELIPVPSIIAWEALTHVLPGANEIKDPRPRP